MSNPITFHFTQTPVRIVDRNGEPWFVASDVAAILGYATAKDMTRNLDDDEKGGQNVPTLGGEQEMTVISESGLYHAIFVSRREEAQAFRRWVTSEVLPAIRRTGSYQHTNAASHIDRLRHEIAGRAFVTSADAAVLAGLSGHEGAMRAAAMLRALGWRKGWIAPATGMEIAHG